jgi:Protein of unknown function (DUF3306)
MAKTGSDDFLSRWSRRKLGEASDEPAPEIPKPESPETEAVKAAVPEAAVPEAESEDQGDPEVMALLPDIDGMDDSSDFTVFLQAGVPEALRRRALRKLWGVNPVLANLDGLNDYDEDYTQLHTLGEGMKTLYRIGKGFVSDESEAPVADAPSQVAESLPESPVVNDLDTPVAAAPQPAPGRDDAPAEPVAERRNTARSRRWGASDPQN